MKHSRIGFAVLLCLALWAPGTGLAAGQTERAEQAEKPEKVNTGQDITRPLARFDLRYEYRNSPNLSQSKDDTHTVTMRVDRPFVLGPKWKLATRFDLPFVFTDRLGKDNTQGGTHFGTGDVLAQATLIHLVSERFAWGAGAQLVFPTASEDSMGSGRYRVAPTVAARLSTGDLLPGSFGALVARWDRSYAENREDSSPTNELQFAPVYHALLPGYWFVSAFPSTDIRYNLGDKRKGDSGRWFVPANFMVGKLLTKEIVSSVEVGVPIVNDYHVYDFKIEFRVGFFF